METLSPEFDWSEVRDALWRMFSDLGAKEVGRRIGLRNKSVYHLIQGRRLPSETTLSRIGESLAAWRPEEFGALRACVGCVQIRLVPRDLVAKSTRR